MGNIKVITFDLWDTIIIDDSDEPKRRKAGRKSKKEERRDLVFEFGKKVKPDLSRDEVNLVYDAIDNAFSKVWHENYVTWKVSERLSLILKTLKIELDDSDFKELVRLHETMELEFMPDIVEGAAEVIKRLSQNYKLGIISDAIFSPGYALRKILEHYGILDCFSHFIFSDEFGESKPSLNIFNSVIAMFEEMPQNIVHIGDREHNDIKAPKRLDMKAILFTGVKDRGSENTEADAVCKSFYELEEIIEKL